MLPRLTLALLYLLVFFDLFLALLTVYSSAPSTRWFLCFYDEIYFSVTRSTGSCAVGLLFPLSSWHWKGCCKSGFCFWCGMHQVYQLLFNLDRLDCKMTQLLLELCWRSHQGKFQLNPQEKNLQAVSMESSLCALYVALLCCDICDANGKMTFSCYLHPSIHDTLVPELRVTWVSWIHLLFYCFYTLIINQVRLQCASLWPCWSCCRRYLFVHLPRPFFVLFYFSEA